MFHSEELFEDPLKELLIIPLNAIKIPFFKTLLIDIVFQMIDFS